MPVLNQFAMDTVQGQIDLSMASQNVITARVGSAVVTPLIPGQPVKFLDEAGGVPPVTVLTANTDKADGFVIRNAKDVNRAAGTAFELARAGTVMYMTAGAAIARGALIEIVYTTNKVITNAGVNPKAGQALDKATADGDLIRVEILNSRTIA